MKCKSFEELHPTLKDEVRAMISGMCGKSNIADVFVEDSNLSDYKFNVTIMKYIPLSYGLQSATSGRTEITNGGLPINQGREASNAELPGGPDHTDRIYLPTITAIMEEITLKAEFIFEFDNKQHWINKGQSRLSGFAPGEKIICIDATCRALTCGADFKAAEEIGSYPVKAYRLVRVIENQQ